jgi:alkanesulfonate monooxygenase SsuD/methylene tetrahydromethanopterin reductase-like flavin-dependent oxidoreductase (luciferase family)
MQIGILTAFNQATPLELMAALGPLVEERGFHSIWVPEHAVFFPEYASRYPYAEDGKLPGSPTGVMEPLTALSFLAAHTRRVRLGTGILILPQRNPVYVARQADALAR